jgi:HEAT repeat protein
MTTTADDLLTRLKAATQWPDNTRVLKEIRRVAESAIVDLGILLPDLFGALSGSDEWVAQDAAEALGAIRDPRAVAPLCKVLGYVEHVLPDDLGGNRDHAILAHAQVARFEADVRYEVAKALGRIGDPGALPALRASVANTEETQPVRDVAQRAIEEIENSDS